jgi:hypothetical protein
MVHCLSSRLYRQCPAIHFLVMVGLGLPLLGLPRVAQANDFAGCTTRLMEAGLEAKVAASACSRSLHPAQVGDCVAQLSGLEAKPEELLAACSQDRRPAELASCVTTIHDQLEVPSLSGLLDHCRRSVLPQRYADCVVGTVAAAQITTTESMALCIAASDRPVDVAPTFIFAQ